MVNQEILTIGNKINEAVSPKRIYLFGSFARNAATEESDYDFYVVVADDAGDKVELTQKIYRSLRGLKKRPVDILVNFESSFVRRAEQNTLERIVNREGILLHGGI